MSYGPVGIDEWVKRVHDNAVAKGWWPNGTGKTIGTNEVLAKLALIHSEVSEALEVARMPEVDLTHIWHEGRVLREGDPLPKPEGFGIELADAVIRIFDLAGALGIDLERCIMDKWLYNESRSHRHGGKKA